MPFTFELSRSSEGTTPCLSSAMNLAFRGSEYTLKSSGFVDSVNPSCHKVIIRAFFPRSSFLAWKLFKKLLEEYTFAVFLGLGNY